MCKNTPLQDAIEKFKTKRDSWSIISGNMAQSRADTYDYVIQTLKSLLPSDKQLIENTWNAGATSTYECVQPQGPCDFDSKKHIEDKQEYLNQFNYE